MATTGIRLSALLLISICFIPDDASVYLAGLRLSPYRLLLIGASPMVLLAALRLRRTTADNLVLIYSLFIPLSIARNQGIATGIESGGIFLLETWVPYFLARTTLWHPEQFRRVFTLIVVVAALMWLLALPEALSGSHFVREAVRSILPTDDPMTYEERHGMLRAMVVFDHPILYGVFTSSAVAFAWYIFQGQPAQRLLTLGGVGLSTFFSLSAGPYLVFVAQAALIAWGRVAAAMRKRWTQLLANGIGVLAVLWVIMGRNPLILVINNLTLNPQTGWTRLLQWEYGIENMKMRPLLGVGLTDHYVPRGFTRSIDSFWLYVGIEFGVIALGLILAAWFVILRDLERTERHGVAPEFLPVLRGISVCLLGMGLVAATVHYWHAMYVYWFFLMGCGATLARACVAQSIYEVEEEEEEEEDGAAPESLAQPRPARRLSVDDGRT